MVQLKVGREQPSVLTFGRKTVNKAELIEALAARLGDRKSATAALDAVISEVQNAVTKGDKVAITGFGSFEKRVRNARTARNPRTGETVKVKKTSVPAFRPGTAFKDMVAAGKVAKAAPALLRDGPVASPEVLLRLPAAMLLLAERTTGVVAVVVELTQVGAGMAVVEARMMASQVGA